MTETIRAFTGSGVRSRRETLGWSQTVLGQRVGVSDVAVRSWECGWAIPKANKLPTLAEALGCTIDDLFE